MFGLWLSSIVVEGSSLGPTLHIQMETDKVWSSGGEREWLCSVHGVFFFLTTRQLWYLWILCEYLKGRFHGLIEGLIHVFIRACLTVYYSLHYPAVIDTNLPGCINGLNTLNFIRREHFEPKPLTDVQLTQTSWISRQIWMLYKLYFACRHTDTDSQSGYAVHMPIFVLLNPDKEDAMYKNP